jgi:hypothetical protein
MAHKYLGKSAKLYPASNPVKKYRICDDIKTTPVIKTKRAERVT